MQICARQCFDCGHTFESRLDAELRCLKCRRQHLALERLEQSVFADTSFEDDEADNDMEDNWGDAVRAYEEERSFVDSELMYS